jgi:hypothetical protein
MTGFLRCRRGLLGVVVALVLSGCVPIPIPPLGYRGDSRTNLPDRVPEFIVTGQTTLEEVLLNLGAPDSYSASARWMAFSSARHTGGVAFIVAGGYSAAVVGGMNSYERRLLVVRFDASSIVIDAALENRVCRSADDAACSTLPDLSEGSKPELAALTRFYVATAEPDPQGINRLIAAEFHRRGLEASTGPAKEAPADVDAILTYRAAWKGDANLDNLVATVRTPGSENALTTAAVDQTARAPKTPTTMVTELVAKMFSDSGKTFLTFPLHELKRDSAAGASLERTPVHIAPVRDARTIARGKVIGERSALGASMGIIDVSPSPVAIIRQLLAEEVTKLGYRSAKAGDGIDIETRLTKFEVQTPSTALYWDINGLIAIDVEVKRSPDRRQLFHYETTCTDRTYVWPSEPVVKGVVSACLISLGTNVREDRALVQLLAGR